MPRGKVVGIGRVVLAGAPVGVAIAPGSRIGGEPDALGYPGAILLQAFRLDVVGDVEKEAVGAQDTGLNQAMGHVTGA